MEKSSAFKIFRLVILDLVIIFSSFILSFFLRGQINLANNVFTVYADYILIYVAIVVVIKMICFAAFGMYRRVWKYASIKDMLAIVEANLISSVVIALVFFITSTPFRTFGLNIDFGLPFFPRSIYIIDFLITLLLVIISRFSERFFNELRFGRPGERKKRVLIVGAGDTGEAMVREMIRQKNSEYIPVGFLDDDKAKLKHQIHGVPVLAPTTQLESMIEKYSIDEVLVAFPSAPGKVRKEIAFRAREAGVVCKSSPSLYEVIDGRVYLDQIREIGVEDILGREAIKVQIPEIVSEIRDKVVLVTGAGGSIGSEICRQLLRFNPRRIVLVDHSENNLFMIEEELKQKSDKDSIIPIVASIRDREVMRAVFRRYRPYIVFHTAAYKHVPLMQLNPEAAFQNNYLGTKILSKVAMEYEVSRFVMLSTDKAVKPRNVMGISKLLTEKYLQTIAVGDKTRFMIVRFGNVLESHGSVVNIFKEQIRSGGPVRVTHPKMRRYLMTIPEASQLAIQACIMGKGGEIYVLNMGDPINILDLATNLIKLYGKEPGKDIDIIYTGPREGEKMDEELAREDEELIDSGFNHILLAKYNGKADKETLINTLFCIEREVEIYDYTNLFRDLKRLVPDFDEKEMWFR